MPEVTMPEVDEETAVIRNDAESEPTVPLHSLHVREAFQTLWGDYGTVSNKMGGAGILSVVEVTWQGCANGVVIAAGLPVMPVASVPEDAREEAIEADRAEFEQTIEQWQESQKQRKAPEAVLAASEVPMVCLTVAEVPIVRIEAVEVPTVCLTVAEVPIVRIEAVEVPTVCLTVAEVPIVRIEAVEVPAPAKVQVPATLVDLFSGMLLKDSKTPIVEFFRSARSHFPASACATSLTSTQNQVQVLRSKLKKSGKLVR